MNEKAHYGRTVVSALAVIATVWAVAHIALGLLKNLIAFCAVYDGEEPAEPISFDEIEEHGTREDASQNG